MHIRPTQKTVLGLLIFPSICLLIIRSAGFPSTNLNVQGMTTGHGGKWHIPSSWIDDGSPSSGCQQQRISNITEAAECALHLALVNNAFIENSRIPLIAHQTSRSADPKTWSLLVRECIQQWILAATGCNDSSTPRMAWFMWDDNGVDTLVQKYENNFYPKFSAIPYPVEKADTFRILVLKWFGGVYGDIDSKPLTHPSTWVPASNLDDWIDDRGEKHTQYQPHQPAFIAPDSAPVSYTSSIGTATAQNMFSEKTINAIFGLEADSLPDPDDTYWRMGYTFPVQITNWAMAMSPHHPVANRFLSDLTARLRTDVAILPTIDPLDLTGPPALTRTVKNYAEGVEPGFSWQSLSSRSDNTPGGRAKVVSGDVLVLPITGFSPGRGRFHNMGSQPISHPGARLVHMATGSWRKADLRVTYGKLCRTVFGLCRDWSRIPNP